MFLLQTKPTKKCNCYFVHKYQHLSALNTTEVTSVISDPFSWKQSSGKWHTSGKWSIENSQNLQRQWSESSFLWSLDVVRIHQLKCFLLQFRWSGICRFTMKQECQPAEMVDRIDCTLWVYFSEAPLFEDLLCYHKAVLSPVWPNPENPADFSHEVCDSARADTNDSLMENCSHAVSRAGKSIGCLWHRNPSPAA